MLCFTALVRGKKKERRNYRGKMSTKNLSFIITCNISNDGANIIISFPPGSGLKIFCITLAVICAIISITTIYLNACAVITIWTTNALRKNMSNFTIMMQSSVDFLNGVIVMPALTYTMISEITGTPNCIVTYVCKKLGSLAFMFSITTFSAMNYERYVGICHPLLHRTRVTEKKLCKYVSVVSTLQTFVL